MGTLASKCGMDFGCNPLTGEIRVGLRYIAVLEVGDVEGVVTRVLKCIEGNREYVTRILEFLEYVPEPINQFMEAVSDRMEKCRVVVLGTHDSYKYSKEYEDHGEYLLEPLAVKDIKYSWQDQTNVRILFEDLVGKLKTKFILNPLQTKKTNWISIDLKEI